MIAGWDVSTIANWVGLLQFGGGLLAAGIGSALWRRLPHRMTWRFSKDDDIVVCLATSGVVDTGAYNRPTTGIGQVKALAYAIPSILTAYGDKRSVRVYLSDEVPAEAMSQNMVVMGGVKNNVVTQRFMTKLAASTGVTFSGGGNVIELDGNSYCAESKDGRVICDYALTIHAPNPFSEGRTWVTILVGSSTYGVAAAAKYLIQKRSVLRNLRRKPFVRICEVDVLHGEIAGITHRLTKICS